MRVIAGSARRTVLKTPEGLDTRPTTDRIKETLFNILQPRLIQSAFLDCFAGSGAIGIEALSRGASEAVLIENDPRALACIRDNLKAARLEEKARILACDIEEGLARLSQEGRRFDTVFLDPPYRLGLEQKTLAGLCRGGLLQEDAWIIVEAALETDFSWAEDLGLAVIREKRYKTNKHVFLSQVTE